MTNQIASFKYIQGLHHKGVKRWQVDILFNKRPKFIPIWLWVRILQYLFKPSMQRIAKW